MKNTKSMFAFFAALILSITSTIGVYSENADTNYYMDRSGDEGAILEEAIHQYNANVIYNELLDQFADEVPDSFAGAYIDKNACLVVQIAQNAVDNGAEVRSCIASIDLKKISELDPEFTAQTIDDVVSIHYVEYSQNELKQLKKEISEFLKDRCQLYSRSVNAKQNRVVVEVDQLNNSLKNDISDFLLQKGYSEDMLCITEGRENVTETNHIRGQEQ